MSCALSSGCQLVAMIGYLFSPERKQDALHELSAGRVAIVIDGVPGAPDHPEFRRHLHRKTAELLVENEAADLVASYDEVLELQSQHPEYYRWSIQRIGRELNARDVIYIRITEFQLREATGHPLMSPKAAVRVKVIDATAPATEARIWPDDIEGFPLDVTRQPKEAGDMRTLDAEARKIGIDLAQYVARLFYEHSLETTVPKAR
jgi:hypothetical protein